MKKSENVERRSVIVLYVDSTAAASAYLAGYLFGVLLGGTIMGIICAVIAKKKNRSGAWFFGGFFLGLIGLIIILCLPDRRY